MQLFMTGFRKFIASLSVISICFSPSLSKLLEVFFFLSYFVMMMNFCKAVDIRDPDYSW